MGKGKIKRLDFGLVKKKKTKKVHPSSSLLITGEA
jgi:hypothetical protein